MWMTRTLLAVAIAGVAVGEAQAAEKKKKATPKPPAAAPAPVKSQAEVAQERLASAWTSKLEGSWSLDLRPASTEQGAPRKDTLTFAGRRVESDMLKQEGTGGSNFTLTPENEQVAVWETMQIAPQGDRILWRGEVRDSGMSGTLIRQANEGPAATWSFKGTKHIAEIPPSPEPAAAPVSPETGAGEAPTP